MASRLELKKSYLFSLFLVVLAVSLPGAFRVANLPQPSSQAVGPGSVRLVGSVNVEGLPSFSISNPQVAAIPFMGLSHNGGPGKSSAKVPLGKSGSLTYSSSPLGVSGGFDGLNLGQSGGLVPPDVQIAAGPSHLLEMVNVEGEIYSKETSAVTTFTLASFFHTGSSFIGDPKVLYDNASGRWFASIIALDNLFAIRSSNVTIAVSMSSDPTGTWKIYSVGDSPNLPDQPIIGVSDDKFAVSVNEFACDCNTFNGARYWILNKAQMVAGASSVDVDSFGPFSSLASVHPAQALSHTTALYMVAAGIDGNGNPTTVAQVFVVTGLPHTTKVSTSSYSLSGLLNPPGASQLNSYSTVVTDDARVEDAAWFQGKLWFGMNIGCIPKGDTLRSCVRLSEIDTTASTLLQDFNFSAFGLNYYYPALRVDSIGNLDVLYGFSGATNSTCCYPSLGVTGQALGDPANSLITPRVLKQGTAPDVSGRYGDYFGAAVDPSDPSLVWVAGEYSSGTYPTFQQWQTFIAAVSQTGYSLSASPSTGSFAVGSSLKSTITVTSLKTFAGTVQFSQSISPSGPTISISPSSVSVAAGGTATATLTISSNVVGNYLASVNATSGSYTRIAMVSLTTSDFGVTASPATYSFVKGTSQNSTVVLSSINGFSGTVHLTTSITPSASGLTATLSTSNVVLSSGGSGTSILTVKSTSSTPGGVYSVSVTGANGSLTHTAYLTAAVTPYTVSFTANNVFTGINVKTVGTFSVDSPSLSLTLSGTTGVTATNSTTGALIAFHTYKIGGLPFGITYIVDVPTSPHLASKITFSLGVSSFYSNVTVTRNRDINQDGSVGIDDLNIVAASFGCVIGSSCYNPAADINGDGTINIIDLVLVASTFGTTDYVPDFSVSGVTTSFFVGSSTSSTITLASVNGGSGNAKLSVSAPAGVKASLSPTSVSLAANGTSTSTLTVSSSTHGTFGVNVTATIGPITHTTTVTVQVQDFNVTGVSLTVHVRVGFDTGVAVWVSSIAGFSGVVSLSASLDSGLTGSLQNTTLFVPSNGVVHTDLVVTPSSQGFFTANVTGTYGGVSRTWTFSFSTCTRNCPTIIGLNAPSGSGSSLFSASTFDQAQPVQPDSLRILPVQSRKNAA